jgi:hypothetical protein
VDIAAGVGEEGIAAAAAGVGIAADVEEADSYCSQTVVEAGHRATVEVGKATAVGSLVAGKAKPVAEKYSSLGST